MLEGRSALDNVSAEDIESQRVRETRERMAAQRAAREAAGLKAKRRTHAELEDE